MTTAGNKVFDVVVNTRVPRTPGRPEDKQGTAAGKTPRAALGWCWAPWGTEVVEIPTSCPCLNGYCTGPAVVHTFFSGWDCKEAFTILYVTEWAFVHAR